jgi:predicted transcriptional regulator
VTKQIVRTGDVADFFDRARDAARRADQGGKFDETVTLSFEDPQRMFTVLSTARRRLDRSDSRTENDQRTVE